MFESVDSVISRYENGEINIYYMGQDFITINKEDIKKYNIKPFFDWVDRPVRYVEGLDEKLVVYCKKYNLPTLFLMDVRNFLIRGFTWEQSVIFYNNNRKPMHPKIRNYILQKKRGYIKESN